MSSGYGMSGHILWNFQDSMGATQVTSQQAIPFSDESLTLSIEHLTEENMYGRFGESPGHQGAYSVEGDISMDATPTAMGWLLKSVVGLTSTTSDTGKQDHVFEMRTADFDCRAAGDPATAEVHLAVGSAGVFYDLCGDSLTLNVANGALVTMDAGFMGAGFSRKAAATPTFPTAKPFIWDQCSISYNGQAAVDVRDLTVTINNNLEAVHTLTGSKAPYRIKRTGQQTIEINGSMVFAAHSYWQAQEAGSEVPLVLTFTSAQSPHVLKLDFPSFRIRNFEPTAGGPGLIEASLTGAAQFNTNSDSAMRVTLTNTQTYY